MLDEMIFELEPVSLTLVRSELQERGLARLVRHSLTRRQYGVAFLIESHIPAFEAILTEPYLLRFGAIRRRSPDMEHEKLAFSHPVPSDRTKRYSASGKIGVFHTKFLSPVRARFAKCQAGESPVHSSGSCSPDREHLITDKSGYRQ